MYINSIHHSWTDVFTIGPWLLKPCSDCDIAISGILSAGLRWVSVIDRDPWSRSITYQLSESCANPEPCMSHVSAILTQVWLLHTLALLIRLSHHSPTLSIVPTVIT